MGGNFPDTRKTIINPLTDSQVSFKVIFPFLIKHPGHLTCSRNFDQIRHLSEIIFPTI